MTNKKNVSIGAIGCALILTGCFGDDNDVATAHGVGLDHVVQALPSGTLDSVNGTYGSSCTRRTSGSTWSVAISNGASLDFDPLSVVIGNTGCVLTLTDLKFSMSGAITAAPSIPLGAAYRLAASSFGSPVVLYANAKLSAVTFDDNFLLTVVYSDDPTLVNPLPVVPDGQGGGSANVVGNPDYEIDLGTISITVDGSDDIATLSGNAVLTPATVTGQTYVIVTGSLGGSPTYGDLDTAYKAVLTPTSLALSIPASDLISVGTNISTPEVRTLIIANTFNDVPAYQAFQIVFALGGG